MMKIKAVCEITGLTDRTIRYYINENLISPSYTENYLGRKTFNFSEADIKELNDISVLRKFGFSIIEIREILLCPEKSINIIQSIKSRKENTVHKEENLLSILYKIDTSHIYTVSELAEELSNSLTEISVPNENIKINIGKTILSVIKSFVVFFIAWLPVIVSCFMIIYKLHYYQYPVFSLKAIFVNLLLFIPTALIILLPKFKISWHRIAKGILLIFCILVTPVSLVSSLLYTVTKSETTSFYDYRSFDTECLANRDISFQKLFPTYPHYFVNEKQDDGSYKTVYLNSKYYYRYIEDFDYTYDIYAEWTLEENDFQEEVLRVKELFTKADSKGYIQVEKGDYTCMFLRGGSFTNFEKEKDNYDYLIFAYDEEHNRVRYICCRSLQDGTEQPYFLTLNWE